MREIVKNKYPPVGQRRIIGAYPNSPRLIGREKRWKEMVWIEQEFCWLGQGMGERGTPTWFDRRWVDDPKQQYVRWLDDGMTYETYWRSLPFVDGGTKMRKYICPAWWYRVTYEKPLWDKCICGRFSDCEHYSAKGLCWAQWDKEFGK